MCISTVQRHFEQIQFCRIDFWSFSKQPFLFWSMRRKPKFMCHFEFYRRSDVKLKKTGKSACQVARTKKKVAVYLRFNCKSRSFCKETFYKGKEETSRVPKNSPELEEKISCWCWLLQKCSLTLEFACFSQLDTSVRL